MSSTLRIGKKRYLIASLLVFVSLHTTIVVGQSEAKKSHQEGPKGLGALKLGMSVSEALKIVPNLRFGIPKAEPEGIMVGDFSDGSHVSMIFSEGGKGTVTRISMRLPKNANPQAVLSRYRRQYGDPKKDFRGMNNKETVWTWTFEDRCLELTFLTTEVWIFLYKK
jgi:hypothetical protein